MRRNKHHTLLELKHPDRDRQAGRQACTHTQARRPLTVIHTLVSLLCSQPWNTWGLETGRGPYSHTKSTSPALKPLT